MFSMRTKLLAGTAATVVAMAFPALAQAQEQAKATTDSTKADSGKKFQIGKPATPAGAQGGQGVLQMGGQGMVIEMVPQGGGKQGAIQLRLQSGIPGMMMAKPDSAAKTDSTAKAKTDSTAKAKTDSTKTP